MRFGRMKLDFNENNDNIDILEAIRTKEGLSDDYDRVHTFLSDDSRWGGGRLQCA